MRDGTEVQGCLPGHKYVLNHLAGLLVQRWVDKLVEAEDEKLVSFPQQFWSILVQQTELTEDLSTKRLPNQMRDKFSNLKTELSHPD